MAGEALCPDRGELLIVPNRAWTRRPKMVRQARRTGQSRAARATTSGAPTAEDLEHDFPVAGRQRLPARGVIGIFTAVYEECAGGEGPAREFCGIRTCRRSWTKKICTSAQEHPPPSSAISPPTATW